MTCNSESFKNTRTTSWRITTYATFSFLHLLIIGKNFKLLQYIFEHQQENLMKELLKEVIVQDSKPALIIEQDKWILGTDNSLPVLLSSWNYGDKYAKY